MGGFRQFQRMALRVSASGLLWLRTAGVVERSEMNPGGLVGV